MKRVLCSLFVAAFIGGSTNLFSIDGQPTLEPHDVGRSVEGAEHDRKPPAGLEVGGGFIAATRRSR